MAVRKVVEIASLSYRYPDGSRGLAEVSLDVAEGQKVAIIGPNGAGKSTLLLHLNGILHTNGAVQICGLRVDKPHLKAIRQKVGLVFQNPDDQLFCPTVFDDVAFGPRNLKLSEEQVIQQVRQSLAAVGLAGFEQRSSFHLSLGEKRRLAIATVLALLPEVLALDEPTSSLDARGRREIIRLLQSIDRTQIIVTHDLDLVRQLCDRVVVLSEGQKVTEGTPATILMDQALLEAHGLV
jgi:cobalt/nickel transport system ATP-binding protein